MAEIRKHNPTTSDIGEQVRALMGETTRPVTPGQPAQPFDDDMYDPFDDGPTDGVDVDGQVIQLQFSAGGDPLIGVLPDDFNSWVIDDGPDSAA